MGEEGPTSPEAVAVRIPSRPEKAQGLPEGNSVPGGPVGRPMGRPSRASPGGTNLDLEEREGWACWAEPWGLFSFPFPGTARKKGAQDKTSLGISTGLREAILCPS